MGNQKFPDEVYQDTISRDYLMEIEDSIGVSRLLDKTTMKLFTGVVIDSFDIGVSGLLVDGRWEGIYRHWYQSGQLRVELNYENGEMVGLLREWYENGQLKGKYNCENGEMVGLQREWYENGQLKEEWNYENGEMVGLLREWYENGQLKGEWNYENGKYHGLLREWYENGQLKVELNRENGKYHGLERWWYPNGQLRREGNNENGEMVGLERWWYPNGQLKVEWNWENGERHGLQREWYENGQLKVESNYENGVKVTPPKSVSPPKSTSPCRYNPDVFLSTMKLLPFESVYRGHPIELTRFDKGEKECVVGYRVCYDNSLLCHDVEFTFRWDCDEMENRISAMITGQMFNRTTSITVNQISQFILQDFYPGY